MSWWVKDQVSINEDGDESLCEIECDDATSLPAADQTATAGFTIVRGSSAKDIATGDKYIMGSTRAWVKQPSEFQLDLAGYATESWVESELEEKASIYDIFGLGRTIAQAGDLNQLTLGRFTCANGTIAAAVTESPWTDSGYFGYTMESVRTGDRFIQIAIRNDDDFKIAKRRYTGAWQPWVYITGTAVASVQ